MDPRPETRNPLLVTEEIRRLCVAESMEIADEALSIIESRVRDMLWQSINRAKENGRSAILRRDI